ncbi:MAG: trypsin-like peptidase domain-containing protein [Okeania sp. SIO3C4]|nr:trypsin-like peptidase domain-containing protein [Okeania sp. SIO3C4]
MSNPWSHFNYLPGILSGTIATLVIVQPAFAKTAREVARVAVPTTVQINNALSPKASGSGVIIAKDGNTYIILTANHVVKNVNSEYIITTSKGKEHPVTSINPLQKTDPNLDLAIVTFETSEEYAVAPLSNSDEATIGSGVYISGYPLPSVGITERRYSFTSGLITTDGISDPQGYSMRYDALTRRGMSGGPVFDVSGRVIGIHGQGETDGSASVQQESGEGQAEIKTGFNLAIPTNTFLETLPEADLQKSDLKMDKEPPENVDAEKVEEEDADNWFNDFAQELLKDVIKDQMKRRIRRVLPF